MNNKLSRENAVVLFSGGQDSTTCLFLAKQQFKNITAICFTYGQKHSLECEIAKTIADTAGVKFRLIDANFISGLASNSLTDQTVVMDKDKPADALPNTFVPGRNLFFLSIAAVIARDEGAVNIVTGVSQTDFSGYPDCRDTFIRSLNVTLNLAMEEQFIIHTPLMWLDKAETWGLADQIGVFDIVREKTLTCYNGVPADGCGDCPACKLRKKGLDEYLESKNSK